MLVTASKRDALNWRLHII